MNFTKFTKLKERVLRGQRNRGLCIVIDMDVVCKLAESDSSTLSHIPSQFLHNSRIHIFCGFR